MVEVEVPRIIANHLAERDILLAELRFECSQESPVFANLRGNLVGLVALPGVRPAPIHRAERVGVGAADKQLGAFPERQYLLLVLKKHHALFCHARRLLSKAVASEVGIHRRQGLWSLLALLRLSLFWGSIRDVPSRAIHQTDANLQSEDASNGVVDARHRHSALVHELDEQVAEVRGIGVHRHVDTRIDGERNGVFLCGGNVIAAPDVVDVRPVRHNHAVPVKAFLQPLCEQAVIRMEGHAVVVGRVDHQAERSCLATHAEGLEILLHHVAIGDARRRAVLAAHSRAVRHVVLQASRHVLHPHAVRVVALQAARQFRSHDAVQQDVLAKAFPYTGPERRTRNVHHRRIDPGDEAGSGLVRRYLSDAAGNGGVEAGALSHFLRKERRAPSIAGAMYLVDAVDLRHTTLLQRCLVESTDDVGPFLGRLGSAKRDIQYGAHPVLAEDIIDRVCRKQSAGQRLRGVTCHRVLHHLVDGEFTHLPYLVFEGHLGEQGLDLRLYFLITRDALRTGWQCYDSTHKD